MRKIIRKNLVMTLFSGLFAAGFAAVLFAAPPGEGRPERPDGPPRGERPDGPPRGERPDGPPRGERPDGPPRRGERPDGPPPPPPFVEALDVNKNHMIDADELANASKLLGKLDKNGDGKLSPEELMGPRRHHRGRPEGGPGEAGNRNKKKRKMFSPEDRFKRFDKDKDGKITKEELPERIREKIMDRLDKDSSGDISLEEFKSQMKNRGKPGKKPMPPKGDGETKKKPDFF